MKRRTRIAIERKISQVVERLRKDALVFSIEKAGEDLNNIARVIHPTLAHVLQQLKGATREILDYYLSVNGRDPQVITDLLAEHFVDEVKGICWSVAMIYGETVEHRAEGAIEYQKRVAAIPARFLPEAQVAVEKKLADETLLTRLDHRFKDNPVGVALLALAALVGLVTAIITLVEKLRH